MTQLSESRILSRWVAQQCVLEDLKPLKIHYACTPWYRGTNSSSLLSRNSELNASESLEHRRPHC